MLQEVGIPPVPVELEMRVVRANSANGRVVKISRKRCANEHLVHQFTCVIGDGSNLPLCAHANMKASKLQVDVQLTSSGHGHFPAAWRLPRGPQIQLGMRMAQYCLYPIFWGVNPLSVTYPLRFRDGRASSKIVSSFLFTYVQFIVVILIFFESQSSLRPYPRKCIKKRVKSI